MVKNFIKTSCPAIIDFYHNGKKYIKFMSNSVHNYFDVPIIVLLYHRVADLETDPQLLAVSKNNFDAQMQFLKANYPILRFEDDWKTVKIPSIVITFDDGYADNYYNALPILEEHKIPATIFISPGNIGTNKEFWWDDLERIVLMNDILPENLNVVTSKGNRSFKLNNQADKIFCYNSLHPLLKGVSAIEREKILKQLKADLCPSMMPRALYRTVNCEELKKLAQSKYITIGGHTITHTQLSIQSLQEQMTEICNSKKSLESIIDKEITTFSYPFGTKNDYTKETVFILEESSYCKAASNFSGQFHKNTNLYEIPRHLIRNWDLIQFKKQLKRFWYL